MKTRIAGSVGSLACIVVSALFVAGACSNLHAALLVTDGGTTNRNTGINLSPADLVVGTNAGNTTVNIIAPGAVTNASSYLGFNASSSTNKVTVQNSGAVWNNSGWLYVGLSGSRNSLIVSNAGRAFSAGGVIGSDFGSSNNQAVITGSGSSWKMDFGELDIGGAGSGNALLIANGGAVTNGVGSIGYQFGANSNQVTVTDGGSVWRLDGDLSVGEVGAGNSLLVTNGGLVSGTTAYLGRYSDGNRANVTGPNSAINLSGGLWPGGVTGTGNTLLIANGGRVANGYGWIGSGGSGNQVTVTGSASSWTNTAEVVVGGNGSGNQLTVETNGTVSSGTDTIIGQYSGAGNILKLTGGTLAVGGALDVRRGTLQLDSGTATATTLWATNGANSSVVFHGGTLITRGGSVGSQFSAGWNSGYPAATWVVLSNATPTTIVGQLNVGSNAVNASLFLTNGGTLSTSGGQIGVNFGSGSVTVSGANSTWNNSGPLSVAWNAASSSLLIANGGTVTNTLCNVGYQGHNNAVTVSGVNSVWNNGGLLTIGLGGGSGSLFVNSGAAASANGMIVGGGSSANNHVTVDGGTLRVTNVTSSAALDIRRGTNLLNAGLIEADQLLMTNAAGNFTFNGGTLITRGGTINNGQDFVVGVNPGFAPATWDVRSNAISTALANGLDFGSNTANATLLITNGATLSVGALTVNPVFSTRIGNNAVATNTLVVVSGAGSLWSNSASLLLGRAGSFNTLLITNGGKVFNGDGVIGLIAGATSNQVTASGAGSLWNNSKEIQVGRSGSGSQLYIASGATVTASNTYVGFDITSSNNLLRVNGGACTATNILDVRRGRLQLDSGAITSAALFATNGPSGQITFNGGTLSVGNATVNNGAALAVGSGAAIATLQLLGNGLHTFANGLVVPVNGRLSGNGTVSGNLTAQANSIVYPGGIASIGRLVLSNSPSFNGSLQMDISKNGATLTNDQIQVIAPLTYGGTLSVSKLGPTLLVNGDSFKLFEASSYAGAFSVVSLPVLSPGLMWTNKLLVNGTIAVVPQTVPRISSVARSGANLVMSVAGGSLGAYYELRSSTNVALPSTSWPIVQGGLVDWLGNATITRAINFNEPQRYYRVLITPTVD